MEFIDLKTQQKRIRADIDRRIASVLEHGQYIMGPEVAELEERLAEFVGSRHCIGLSSGTDALLIALMALEVGPGDEIITSPFTFISSGEAIVLAGATPVFVDIDHLTYNIDPEQIEPAITPRTKAILAVSLYGQCADFSRINTVADAYGLPVIEDGAQSFGATWLDKHSCHLSTIGCTSFFPSKPLGGYGDGGACFTDDETLAEKMRQLRVHGQSRRYHHPRIGMNARLDTLQAAVLLAKMTVFPEEVLLRKQVASRYDAALGDEYAPFVAPGAESVYAQYTIYVERRAQLQEELKYRGVPTAIHYPAPLHQQPAFDFLNLKEKNFPVAERAAEHVISLPMHPYLTASDQGQVLDAVRLMLG